MPAKISEAQRSEIIRCLEEGLPREAIAKVVGVTPGQVSAVAAHVTMRTYDGSPRARSPRSRPAVLSPSSAGAVRTDARPTLSIDTAEGIRVRLGARPDGTDAWWNPSPQSNTLNPHLLILGESGSGKTYTVQCLCAELAQQNIPTIVFDYAQGFASATVTPEFRQYAHPIELNAARDGIDINPLTIFESDIYGPINVAQRVADTFARVYPKIGVQQHAVLRDAILAVFADFGIRSEDETTWKWPPPVLSDLRHKLTELANDQDNLSRRHIASVASHISTFFVFNTFRGPGVTIDWRRILASGGKTYVLQLKGLEYSLERIVTELLLWNFIGFLESLGPGPLRCFVLLDEAHRLSFDENSPVERLLREGRKFGVGAILASQQPEDFSSVAYSNTANKIIFNLVDRTGDIARQIASRTSSRDTIASLLRSLGTLPRGTGIFIGNGETTLVKISPMTERAINWRPHVVS